jgi:hypothetical protein
LYDIIKLMAEQTATEDEEAIPIHRVHVATSYHDGHGYSRSHTAPSSICVLEKK